MIVAIIILIDMCKAKMCKYFSSDATNQNNAWFVFHFLSYALLLRNICQKHLSETNIEMLWPLDFRNAMLL